MISVVLLTIKDLLKLKRLQKYRPTKSRKTKTEDISSSKNFHVFTDLSPNTEYQVELLPTYEDVISQFTNNKYFL